MPAVAGPLRRRRGRGAAVEGASDRSTGAPRLGATESADSGDIPGHPLRFAKRVANTSTSIWQIQGTRPLFHILQEFSESDSGWLGYFETDRGHFANFEVTALPSDPHSIVSESATPSRAFAKTPKRRGPALIARRSTWAATAPGRPGCYRFELIADTVQ